MLEVKRDLNLLGLTMSVSFGHVKASAFALPLARLHGRSGRDLSSSIWHGVVDEETSSPSDLVRVWTAPLHQQMNGNIHSVDRPVPHITLMGATTRNAARLVLQQRLNYRPLKIRQIKTSHLNLLPIRESGGFCEVPAARDRWVPRGGDLIEAGLNEGATGFARRGLWGLYFYALADVVARRGCARGAAPHMPHLGSLRSCAEA